MLKEIKSYEELLKCHLKYFTAIYDDKPICGTVLVYNDHIRLRYNQHIKDGIQYDICIYNDISTECFCNLCVMIEEFTNLNNKKMDKEILKKWDNTCIKVLSEEHGKQVINFWQSVGINTVGWFDNQSNYYYGIFNGLFNNWSDEEHLKNQRILTLEEAIAIRDKKTFPREMYVWDDVVESGEVVNVVWFDDKNCQKYKFMGIVKAHYWQAFKNAMEIEEYEAMNKNKDIINEIAETKKQMNSLNDKLIELEKKLK